MLFENYKSKVNQSIKNLNNILIDMDDVYNEALFLIEDGEIFNARKKFKTMLARANKDIEQEDIKVISLTNKALETANPTLNMSIKNYKELWDKTRIDILKKIKDIADKFKIRSELESQIKKIFKFEIDNSFNQSFLLDRILYVVHAGDIRETSKYYICDDALLKRVLIEGNRKTTISKLSLVAKPDSINMINEKVTGGEHDIDWSINIEAFFEGREGLKLWSEIIYAKTKYIDWKNWNYLRKSKMKIWD